jgi:hypothetical protein
MSNASGICVRNALGICERIAPGRCTYGRTYVLTKKLLTLDIDVQLSNAQEAGQNA